MTDFSQATLTSEKRANLIDELSAYADTDLLCYFADEPRLYSQQVRLWEPVLRELESKWGLQIARTKGIMPISQPAELKEICKTILTDINDSSLVAMAQIVTRLGSILLAVALKFSVISVDEAISASELDEGYQAEEWGEDEAISDRLASRAEKIRAAHAYLESQKQAA